MRTWMIFIAFILSFNLGGCANYFGNPHSAPVATRIVPVWSDTAIRVEPLSWWTGMVHNQVELLVYFPQIQEYSVKLGPASGVRLIKDEMAESANYRFITLDIRAQAPPQRVPIVFSRGKESFTHEFPILARRNTPKAQGVDSRDAVYLIFPDRFCNGDTSNDAVPGMREGAQKDSLEKRYGGDLAGIRKKLDYLQDLGVTAIWLNPELENDQSRTSYHGYAITDLYHVDRRMGTNEQLRDLVDKLHRRGMKYVRDIIPNHIGFQHPWMADLPMKNWVNQWPEFTQTNYRAPTMMDPYASEYDREHFNKGWFVRDMPDLNQQNPHVARYLLQQAIWWIEFAGIDAFRVDTYSYSDPEFLSEWGREIAREYPSFTMFGEVWEPGVPIQGYFADDQPGFKKFDSNLPGVIDFQLMWAIHEALTKMPSWNEGITKVYQTLAQDYFYKDPFRNLIMLDNHDFTRFYSTVNGHPGKFRSGIAFLFTTRGIPQLYYGTEVLMSGITDVNYHYVRLGFPGGFPGDPVDKFSETGRTQEEREAFDFIRTLMRYRRETTALQTGKLMQFAPEDGVYTYFRYDSKKTVMVVLNTNKAEKSVNTARFAERMKGFTYARDVISGKEIKDLKQIQIPADSPLVLELIN